MKKIFLKTEKFQRIHPTRDTLFANWYHQLEPATLLEATLLHGCFCTNGTEVRKASHYTKFYHGGFHENSAKITKLMITELSSLITESYKHLDILQKSAKTLFCVNIRTVGQYFS